jgi:hypothetical protein
MNALRYSAATVAMLAAGLALAGRITIVSEQQAPQSWQPAPDQARFVAGYPSVVPDKSRDVCVNIGYLIKADGSTSDFVEMKSWSSREPEAKPEPSEMQPFVQIAAAVVSRWHFVPVGKPHSIYTSAAFAFDGSKALGEEAIRGRCRIDDLAAFVARANSDKLARGDLNRSRAERTRAEREAVEPMGSGYR